MSLRVWVISIKLQKAGFVGARGETLGLRRLCAAGGGRPAGAGGAGPATCLPGVRGLREARPHHCHTRRGSHAVILTNELA